MATASDGRTPYESRGDGENSRKRRFRPEINEEPQNVLQEPWQNNSTQVSDQGGKSASMFVTIGISDLEQMLKHMTFTRSEFQHLTALMQSRICDNVVERDATGLPQPPTTIDNLPGDLLLNIFIRLLAKQLAQMRCISKSWNALLSQSSFVKSHLHHSINNNNQILLVFYNNASKKNQKVFTAYRTQSPHLELTNFIKLPRLSPRSGHTDNMINIIGSVHGLICSSYADEVIHIWNPSLSALSTLPPYSFPYCIYHEFFFRFGYDPKTDDYKVVKITGMKVTNEQLLDEDDVPSFPYVIKTWLPVEIYSMRKGSWKLISQKFPSHITRIFNMDEVCVDGHDGRLHWVGHFNKKHDSEMIVAFDLGSETFLEMKFPDSILDYNRSNTLGVSGGNLCVMSRDGNGGIDVWVMKEYGVGESWVKCHVFHFSHDLSYDVVTGFTSRDQFLVEDDDDCLVLYDPIADKTEVLEEYCPGRIGANKIVEYIDSLVWVAPSREMNSI